MIQYEFGKTTPDGFVQTGSLTRPPDALLTALSTLEAKHLSTAPDLVQYLSKFIQSSDMTEENFSSPGAKSDILYPASYKHIGAAKDHCSECDSKQKVDRKPRRNTNPRIHYGIIGSSNQVMRDGKERERLREKLSLKCFEMEAAGLMDNFRCLVIRGICDYADSHKNKDWQGYAAATAAAYAKEFLGVIPANRIMSMNTLDDELKKTGE